MNNLGIITYNFPHLKTEQILESIVLNSESRFNIKLFLLPYKIRKKRKVLFEHRPDQTKAASPEEIACKHGFEMIRCINDTDIDNSCDIYLITGAGILSSEAISEKKVLNCHPGIIPLARGLDSFKWSIYKMIPLGVTLHYINEEVDSGVPIAIQKTNIYRGDSLEILARRHYENEINLLSNFYKYLKNPEQKKIDNKNSNSMSRMPFEEEKKMITTFDKYIEKFT